MNTKARIFRHCERLMDEHIWRIRNKRGSALFLTAGISCSMMSSVLYSFVRAQNLCPNKTAEDGEIENVWFANHFLLEAEESNCK